MDLICNGCEYLDINEQEQHWMKQHLGYYPPHICLKFNKRVFHYPDHEPNIHPCEECWKGKEINE